jgi:periplasmic copper chaperone A
MKWGLFLFVCLVLLGSTVGACTPAARTLEVKDAWARPGFIGGSSGVYLTIDNRGGEADTLLSASTTAAQVTELHRSMMDSSGTMRMEPLDSVEVPGNSTVSLAPGGLHVMLVNLQQDLAPGNTFELQLTFQNRGQVSLTVTVNEPQ